MAFNKKPDTLRPVVRQSYHFRGASLAEKFFGAVAKVTLLVAAVIAILLAVFSGSYMVGTSRKECGIVLGLLAVIGMIFVVRFYYP